jgi:DNA-binding response OmpR family regulator
MSATDGRSTQVLLVEDDELVASYLREVLGMAGEVHWMTAAGPALGQAGTRQWDLVVSDFELADGTGSDLVRAFRERDPEVATMILSAHADADHEALALDAGADRYLTKPISPGTLLAETRALVELTASRRSAAAAA